MTARAETIKAERRRRNSDGLSGKRRRLGLRADLDTDNFVYRWANDEKNRIHDLTVNDDWEVVSDRSGEMKPDAQSSGTAVATVVGTGDAGRPVRAVLLRKRKDWHEEDRRAGQRLIDETEASLKAGQVPGGGNDGGSYVPKDGIVFQHGGRV